MLGRGSGAQPGWRHRGEDARRELLLGCGAALAERVDELAALLTAEQGKPLRDARAEVSLAADCFRHTAQLSAGGFTWVVLELGGNDSTPAADDRRNSQRVGV